MNKKLPDIEIPKDEEVLWRYMSLEKFANILAKKHLFFARVDTFEDPFEGVLPLPLEQLYQSHMDDLDADMQQAIFKLWDNMRKHSMCNSWYCGKHQSMAMWEKHHMRSSGVAIKTNMKNLKDSLPCKPDVFIGKIKYEFETPNTSDTLDAHVIYSALFYKRRSFEHENEVRAIIDNSQLIDKLFKGKRYVSREELIKLDFPEISEKGNKLKIDVATLISKVVTSPYTDQWVADTVKSIVRKYGYKFNVCRSNILDKPNLNERCG